MSLAIPSTLDILTLGKSTMNLFSVLMKIRYRRHEISLGIASGEKEPFVVLSSLHEKAELSFPGKLQSRHWRETGLGGLLDIY